MFNFSRFGLYFCLQMPGFLVPRDQTKKIVYRFYNGAAQNRCTEFELMVPNCTTVRDVSK